MWLTVSIMKVFSTIDDTSCYITIPLLYSNSEEEILFFLNETVHSVIVCWRLIPILWNIQSMTYALRILCYSNHYLMMDYSSVKHVTWRSAIDGDIPTWSGSHYTVPTVVLPPMWHYYFYLLFIRCWWWWAVGDYSAMWWWHSFLPLVRRKIYSYGLMMKTIPTLCDVIPTIDGAVTLWPFVPVDVTMWHYSSIPILVTFFWLFYLLPDMLSASIPSSDPQTHSYYTIPSYSLLMVTPLLPTWTIIYSIIPCSDYWWHNFLLPTTLEGYDSILLTILPSYCYILPLIIMPLVWYWWYSLLLLVVALYCYSCWKYWHCIWCYYHYYYCGCVTLILPHAYTRALQWLLMTVLPFVTGIGNPIEWAILIMVCLCPMMCLSSLNISQFCEYSPMWSLYSSPCPTIC